MASMLMSVTGASSSIGLMKSEDVGPGSLKIVLLMIDIYFRYVVPSHDIHVLEAFDVLALKTF